MTFSNAEFPDDPSRASGREPAGMRPMPVGAGAGGGSATNRPIPVQSRPDQVPEVYEQDDEEQDDLREILRNAFSDLVVSDHMLDQLGPAIISQTSIFVYGPTGNGKPAWRSACFGFIRTRS